MTTDSIEAVPIADAPAEPALVAPAPARRATRPVDVAAAVIAVGVVVALLRWAEAFFVPLLLGILTSYTLGPLVTWLHRWHVPRLAGAALVLGTVIAAGVGVGYTLADDAVALAERLPLAAKKLRQVLREQSRGAANPIVSVQKAAVELEKAAAEASGVRPAPQASTHEGAAARINTYLVNKTSGIVALAAELILAVLIAYFLLAAGDAFRRKLVRIAGPSLARRRVTLQILNDINSQVQRYLLVLTVTNILIGIATWALFEAVGIEGAGLWGGMAALLHVVPYAGIALIAVAGAVAGLVQFGGITEALLLAGGTLIIATIIGTVFNTWLQGRASRMNAVVIFVGLLFFGWLWGAWGLLLGVPLLAVLKTIADHVDGMQAVSELMAD
jgi:predicted PurR-regulated permease PerM